jgi:hypothetical protein
MRRFPTLPLLVAMLFVSTHADANSLLSPVLTNAANGRAYALLHVANATESENVAKRLGAHLVTLRSAAEQQWVFDTFAGYGGISKLLWIGLNDAAREDYFLWNSGERPGFSFWANGEPNNTSGSEPFAAMYYPGHSEQGRWNDWSDRQTDPVGLPFHAVIEFVPGVSRLLVSTGAVWKFWDQGTDLGTAWRAPGYDDSAWSTGLAQLGYGDGNEATVISFGANPSAKHITSYFRRAFVVTNAASVRELMLSVLRDDGVAAYLNGTEVYRNNLPANATFNTPASLSVGGGDELNIYHSAFVSPQLLVEGTNVLAIEIHQSSGTSADVSFDAQLLAKVANLPPVVNVLSPRDGELFGAPLNLTLSATAHDDGTVTNVEFHVNGMFVAADTAAPFSVTLTNFALSQAHVFAVATDNEGVRATSFVAVARFAPEIVARGASWRYFDQGADLGVAWRKVTFDDSAWATGSGEFGYGDGDERTVVSFGGDLANKHITTYFRHEFMVWNPGLFTNLLLHVVHDDGVVLYLNDVEVARHNMPNGTIQYSTFASTAFSGSDESRVRTFAVPASLLQSGRNVLAAEVHQASVESTDLSFDLAMVGYTRDIAPLLEVRRGGSSAVLRWDAFQLGYAVEVTHGLTPPVSWLPANLTMQRSNGLHQVILPNSSSNSFFRLRR